MPTTVVTAAADIRYCKPGDQGVEVQRWQYFLRSQTGVFPKPPLNGTFDAATERAKDAADRLVRLLQSWERAKLLHLILTCAGAFVPRYMRGKAPKAGEAEDATKLSNHTWGTAFDINAKWNGLYQILAILPAIGCVRELANIAETSGFYWGGHYKSDRKGNTRQDGMHFEIGQPST